MCKGKAVPFHVCALPEGHGLPCELAYVCRAGPLPGCVVASCSGFSFENRACFPGSCVGSQSCQQFQERFPIFPGF